MRKQSFLKNLSNLFALLGTLGLAGQWAEAQEMASRLGVGFRTAPVVETPLVSLQYYPSSDTALLAGLGVDTLEKNSKLALLGGLRQVIFKENQLNFFWGGNVTMITDETNGTSKSGFDLGIVFATEFFFSGLENLGFNVESGFGVSNIDKVRFRTIGQSFIQAGVHFYF
jgi:hypothetical protein